MGLILSFYKSPHPHKFSIEHNGEILEIEVNYPPIGRKIQIDLKGPSTFKILREKLKLKDKFNKKNSKVMCPACEKPNCLVVERRPDGDAYCRNCEWQGPYSECFVERDNG